MQSAMDIGRDDIGALQLNAENDGEQPENVNISDVLEAITLADPLYGGVDTMARAPARQPTVEIVEQPASKALRFRYECEGRSAGSIPGANSTSESKTYPTLRINDYIGPCTIVASCVTKDEPYRPHPHNLVGRDRCDKGVCTIRANITEEVRTVQFRNLGIQCVKKKDVETALQQRSALRVDPFRTGFDPRTYQSIELNSVRLAFQVFLPDQSNQMRMPLRAIVSDVIHDKKAMGELAIVRASHCSGSMRGGTQMVLLTEKVSREEVTVMFFDKSGWRAPANVILVHKQVAIVIETPPYRDPNTSDHMQVEYRLQRGTSPTSEDDMSKPFPFEYIPEYPGTERKPPPDLAALALLLAAEPVSSSTDTPHTTPIDSSPPSETPPRSPETIDVEMLDPTEKGLNDLLDQVAELDEIYSENRTRFEQVNLTDDMEEDFNDAGTYTSLQLAFKNPVDITEPYEDIQVQTFRGPIIEFTHLKPESDEAPPLPPKRVRKSSNSFKSSQTSVDSILKPGKQIPVTRNPDVLTGDKVLSPAKSEPALPPAKKRSFFDRIFRRKHKSPSSVISDGKKGKAKPVGRSVSSVSGIRPTKFKSSVSHTSLKDNASTTGLSYADSVTHISLHGDDNEKSTSQNSLRRPASLHPLPPIDGDTILVAESVLALDANAFKKLQDDLELTDAEHYALYMAVAPHATVSEFDETSCYYSPIDGRTFLPEQIKVEPKSSPPTHQMTSPHQQMYSPVSPYGDQQQNWMAPNPLNPFAADIQWPTYQQYAPSPSPQGMTLSPIGAGQHPAHSPGLPPLAGMASPGLQGHVSPGLQHGTGMGHASPGQHQAPMGHVSPGLHAPLGHVSPGLHASPMAHGHISPGLQQQQTYQMMGQMAEPVQAMDSGTPSISGLLNADQNILNINSSELFSISAMNAHNLSDSLTRLSTSDLQQHLGQF